MQTVALGWHVYEATGRPLDLGLMGLAQFTPVLLFSLVAGQVADRVDRRYLLAACTLANAALAAALVAVALLAPGSVWPLYAIGFALGVVKAFSAPAAKALVPSLVPLAALPSAIALGSGLWQLATIAGPALGGVVLAIAGEPAWVYAVAAVLAAAAAALTSAVRPRPRDATAAPSADGMWQGVRFVLGQPVLFGALTLDLCAVFLGGATALLPVFAKDVLAVGPLGLGLLRASPAVGAGLMAVALARFPIQRRAGPTLFASVAIFGLATVGFGLSRHLALSIACLALLGAADMISVVIRGVLVQLATPDDMRGRVSAVSTVFIVASNELGELESGLLATLIGAVGAVVVGGGLSVAVVLACALAFPALRRADRLA
jgi:MFS family permease